jgi:hypothetical protein
MTAQHCAEILVHDVSNPQVAAVAELHSEQPWPVLYAGVVAEFG